MVVTPAEGWFRHLAPSLTQSASQQLVVELHYLRLFHESCRKGPIGKFIVNVRRLTLISELNVGELTKMFQYRMNWNSSGKHFC